jgi:ABC-type uncharacterized transport system permease subunit
VSTPGFIGVIKQLALSFMLFVGQIYSIMGFMGIIHGLLAQCAPIVAKSSLIAPPYSIYHLLNTEKSRLNINAQAV